MGTCGGGGRAGELGEGTLEATVQRAASRTPVMNINDNEALCERNIDMITASEYSMGVGGAGWSPLHPSSPSIPPSLHLLNARHIPSQALKQQAHQTSHELASARSSPRRWGSVRRARGAAAKHKNVSYLGRHVMDEITY